MSADAQSSSRAPTIASAWWSHPAALRLGWLATAILAAVLIIVSDYRLHDPDSKLYTELASELAVRPVSEWCAPSWNGHWHRTDLFREHPPLLLWLGALANRFGVPAAQALALVNFAALFAGLALLYRVALRIHAPASARLAVGLWLLSPIFVQYLVRANQEHPLATALLLALFASVVVEGVARAGALWSLALLLAVGVKGSAGLSLIAVGAAHWVLWERSLRRLLPLLIGTTVLLLAAIAFEGWYGTATGESFWAFNLERQVGASVGGGRLLAKLANLVYYQVRPLWYGLPILPWVWLGLYGWVRHRRPAFAERRFWLGIVVAALFVGAFSLADRKADRYIFAMYPCLSLSATWVIEEYLPRLRHLVLWLDQRRAVVSWCTMAFVLFMVLAKIGFGSYFYRFIRIWPGA
jgi:4-amino-4-deoxy-L-arabinose transferase-like glycosyltransferase